MKPNRCGWLSLWALVVAIGQVPVEAQEAVIVGRLADGTDPEAVGADWGAGLKIREMVVRALPGRTVTIHRVDDSGRAVRTSSGPRADADTDSPESPAYMVTNGSQDETGVSDLRPLISDLLGCGRNPRWVGPGSRDEECLLLRGEVEFEGLAAGFEGFEAGNEVLGLVVVPGVVQVAPALCDQVFEAGEFVLRLFD
jgi:hypothetical protein